jgi:hypothetical protein
MRKLRLLFPVFLLGITLLLPNVTRAQTVLYSTFGPDYAVDDGWNIFGFQLTAPPPPSNGGPNPTTFLVANGFTLPGGPLTGRYAFTRLDLGVGFLENRTSEFGLLGPGPFLFQVQLATDLSGTPGTVLETWTISSPTAGSQVFTVLDAINLELAGGQPYWVIVSSAGSPFASGGWDLAKQVPANYGPTAGSSNGSPWFVSDFYQNAFDIWGKPINLFPPPQGLAFNQILRTIVAGPVTPPAGGPVEVNVSYTDLSGNAIGPSTESPVTVFPGQSVSFDFPANEYVKHLGQRIEVVPVITAVANPNGGPSGTVQASVEVLDAFLGFGTVFTRVPAYPPTPAAPTLVPQVLAGGQTMQVNVVAFPGDPCVGQVSFKGPDGSPRGSITPINLSPGMGTSVPLTAESVGLKHTERMNVQPVVTVTPPIVGTAEVAPSVCQASVEVFDNLTGRTQTYQTGTQVPAVQ